MKVDLNLRIDGVSIIQPQGRLDLLTAPAIKKQISTAIADGYMHLLIDLAGVTFMDSSGLGVLLGSLKAARLAGGDLKIARATEQARVILELTTLNRILVPYNSVEEALGVFTLLLAQ
ncbi:MAG TPA: STAS domain-containing protein [Roseiflexaceae bacterium]|nr:STAS domain-containing protein [Roseiflexaceae bacterium]